MALRESGEDYLEAILMLHRAHGVVRSVDIADQLGVELEIQAMDFAMVLSSVDLGESDMAISGFGWKEDREISFELSDGFNKTGEAACQGLLIRRADAEQFPTLESFDGNYKLFEERIMCL